jgi:molybdopterin converting factor small subunit
MAGTPRWAREPAEERPRCGGENKMLETTNHKAELDELVAKLGWDKEKLEAGLDKIVARLEGSGYTEEQVVAKVSEEYHRIQKAWDDEKYEVFVVVTAGNYASVEAGEVISAQLHSDILSDVGAGWYCGYSATPAFIRRGTIMKLDYFGGETL